MSSPQRPASALVVAIGATAVAGIAGAPTAAAAESGGAVHVVTEGETLGHIALRNRTTVGAIAAANAVPTPGLIQVGQRLVLPPPPTPAPDPAAAPPAPPPAPTVTVAADDTLGHIAARAGITLEALLASSGLDRAAPIRPGQQVTLPAPPPPPAPAPVASTFAGRTYPPEVTAAATANRDALAARGVPSRDDMRSLITTTALQMGVEPALALAVAHQESGFNAAAVSPANAVGAMQVIPSSGRWASTLVGRDLDLLDPTDNTVAGVAILRSLLGSTGGDVATAVAGYYQGLASVRRNGLYDDTRRYAANVQTLAARYR